MTNNLCKILIIKDYFFMKKLSLGISTSSIWKEKGYFEYCIDFHQYKLL